MLLAIDVGNTETKLGCFADGNRLTHHWRVTTEAKRTADEYGVFITQLFATAALKTNAITAVAMRRSSVATMTRDTTGEAAARRYTCSIMGRPSMSAGR